MPDELVTEIPTSIVTRTIAMGIIVVVLLALSFVATDVSPAGKTTEFVEASTLLHLATSKGYQRDINDLRTVYRTAKHLGATCLPEVFGTEDFLAIAFVESAFNPRAVGGAGEVGIWQILKYNERLKRVGGTDPFDIPTNGAMACQVLREKYKHRRGHVGRTIQSYNGWYRRAKITLPYYQRVTRIKQHFVSSS